MASKEQNKLIAEQTAMLKAQLGIMRDLAKAAQQIDFGGMSTGFEKMNSAIKDAGENLDGLNKGQQTLADINKAAKEGADGVDDIGKRLEKFGKKAMKASARLAAFKGFGAGLSFSINSVKMLSNVMTSLSGTIFNLASSIISLPFKVLYGLMNNVGQGGTALRQEFEKVRGTFGDLTQNEGRDIIQSWRRIDHFGGQLAETGLSIWRTMGNMAESMAAVREIAEKMGPLFHNFGEELNYNGERIFAYQKGLHLTDEGLRAVTEQAQRAGTSFQEVGREITSTAFALGDAFSMNGAIISQDVGTMIDDFDHFGNLSIKTLSQVSVYARKLGIEIEKLTGSLDAFSDFDKAAENVSQLSQAFGLQLDTLQMVQEQDPAANMDRLRKAFFATGRTIETMTRQERALLAQSTGLDQKTASLVFSQKNAGMSYGEITKQGANAEKQQLSQVEAMERLSNSIQRLVKQGPQLKGGFFDIFMQGFFRGIKWTREFWQLMRKLRYAMRMTYRAGRRVGQMFVRYFPGVKDMLRGMGDLFDRARWRRMLRGVVSAFKDFFKDLTTNPSIALSSLFKKLKSTFFDWFDSTKPSGMKLINGIKTFAKAMSSVFAQLIRVGMKGAADAIRGIISFIIDPSSVISAAGSAGGGFVSFIMELLEPAWKAIKENWPALRDALYDLFLLAWNKVVNLAEDNWKTIAKAWAIIFLGPAIINSLISYMTTRLAAAFLKFVVGFMGGPLKAGVTLLKKGVSSVLGAGSSLASNGASGGAQAMAEVGATAGGAKAVEEETRGFGVREAANLGAKLIVIAGAIAIGGVLMAISVIAIKGILSGGGINKKEDVILPLSILAATIFGMVGIAVAMKLLEAVKIDKAALKNAGIGIAAMVVLSIIMAVNFLAITAITGGITSSEADTAIKSMELMTGMYLAASVIILAAAGIGLLMSSFSGMGALSVLAGIATIAVVVTGMSSDAADLIKVINHIKISAGFERKSKAFITIMNSIGEFAKNIGGIIEATRPSFTEILSSSFGGNPINESERTVGTVTKVISAIGGQAEKLISIIASSIESININDLKKADKISNILTAIGGIAGALAPANAVLESFFLVRSETINAAAQYITDTTESVIKLIKASAKFLKDTNDLPIVDENKIKSLSVFLSAVGGLVGAITPGELATRIIGSSQNLRQVNIHSDSATVSDPISKFIGDTEKYIKMIIVQFGTLLPVVSEFIKKMIDMANSIPANKIKRIELVSNIVSGVLKAISTLSSSLKIDPESLRAMAGGDAGTVSAIGELLNSYSSGIFSSLQLEMPAVIEGILELATKITPRNVSRLKSIIPVIISTFDLISSLTGVVNKLGEGGTNITTGRAHFNARVTGIKDLLSSLLGSSGEGSMIASIKSFGNIVIPRQATANATRLKAVLGAILPLGEILSTGMYTSLSAGGSSINAFNNFFSNLLNKGSAEKGKHWLDAVDSLGSTLVKPRASANADRLKSIIESIMPIGDLLSTEMFTSLSAGGNKMKSFNAFFGHMFIRSWAEDGVHWLDAIDNLGALRLKGSPVGNARHLKSIIDEVSILGDSINIAATSIDEQAILTVANGVTALTDRIAAISYSLNNVTGFNIATKLTKLNHDLGLSSKGNRLSIAQRPVELNVNFEIKLKADDLEHILLYRDGSNMASKNGKP